MQPEGAVSVTATRGTLDTSLGFRKQMQCSCLLFCHGCPLPAAVTWLPKGRVCLAPSQMGKLPEALYHHSLLLAPGYRDSYCCTDSYTKPMLGTGVQRQVGSRFTEPRTLESSCQLPSAAVQPSHPSQSQVLSPRPSTPGAIEWRAGAFSSLCLGLS